MHRWVRPFLLVTIVSFLLGLWLSLRRAEHSLLAELKALPEVVLLTDQPSWWKGLSDMARRENIAELRVVQLPRKRWSEVATAQNPNDSCDLVAFPSFYAHHFIAQKWIKTLAPRKDSLWDQVHPDFRDIPSGVGRGRFLPLIWSLSFWLAQADKDGRLEVRTSIDEALLLALDLHPAEIEIEEQDAADSSDFAQALWTKTQGQITLNLNAKNDSEPPSKIKASQVYATRIATEFTPLDNIPKADKATLSSYGISLCASAKDQDGALAFLDWLIKPENVTLLSYSAGMASTFSSSDAGNIPATLRPSYLRKFSLALIRQRELNWDLASAWHDLLLNTEAAPASR